MSTSGSSFYNLISSKYQFHKTSSSIFKGGKSIVYVLISEVIVLKQNY